MSIGGPYTVPIGGQVALNSSGTDPEGAALSFAWDLDGDLLYETARQNLTFSAGGASPAAPTPWPV